MSGGGAASADGGAYVWQVDAPDDHKQHAYDYDLIVIGGGSGGIAAAKEAGKLGAKVRMYDFVTPSPPGSKWGVGGTCVNVGCIPKKLFHTAVLCHEKMADGEAFGWQLSAAGVQHKWSELVGNVQAHIKGINSGYKRLDLPKHNVEYVNERAQFVDAHTVQGTNAKGEATATVSARRIVIACGGRPTYPDIPGAREYGITSDDVFMLRKAPGKTCVVGASYVALECAGFLHGLGYDTTVLVRSILLRGFDQEMAEHVGAYMVRVGVRLVRDVVPTRVERIGDDGGDDAGRLRVTYAYSSHHADEALRGTDAGSDVFDTVLFAIGRTPSTLALGVDKAGLDVDAIRAARGKIDTDAGERTCVPHIYALGDVRHQPELTPLAIQQGRLLARRLYARTGAGADDGDGERVTTLTDYDHVPTTVFTPLEYGFVGLSEDEAVQRHGADNIAVYHTYFTPLEWNVPHFVSSMTVGDEDKQRRPQNTCYLKLVCDKRRNERVLGFHVLADNAGEITQGVAVAIKCGATKQHFDDTIGIHPTDAEQFTKVDVLKGSGVDPQQSTC